MATKKQAAYIKDLLARQGLGVAIVTRRHVEAFGGLYGEWLGKPVDALCEYLDTSSASILIDDLKEQSDE